MGERTNHTRDGLPDAHLGDERDDDEETRGNDGLPVHDVDFLRDGGGDEAGAEHDGPGLGDEAAGRRRRLDNLRRPLSRRRLVRRSARRRRERGGSGTARNGFSGRG